MKFVAIDLGASSGRVMLARLEIGKIELEEIHRFTNGGIHTPNGFLWDHAISFSEILKGLSKVSEKFGAKLDGIAITTWGVDYVLLDEKKKPLSYFYHYRDERTNSSYEKIFKIIPKDSLFSITGLQFMRINTICQLNESIKSFGEDIGKIKHFLMIPDYFTFLLTGETINEYTDASTTQLLDSKERTWSKTILDALGIPLSIFQTLTHPGKRIGTLIPLIAKKTGLSADTPIFSTASHDTASAVAAVPCDQDRYRPGEWAYLSSGTWSLLGVEMPEPILSTAVAKYNFTNEGGVCETIRLLKNITGFWILEECMKLWKEEIPDLTWEKIIEKAKKSSLTNKFIDINHLDFVSPSNMIRTINTQYKRKYHQEIGEIGDICRMIYASMVKSYQETREKIEDITKVPIKILHIVGGGAKNEYLNQLIADGLNIPVIAGPVEATAIGNVLMQAIGTGIVKDLIEGRRLVRNSFDVKNFNPSR